MNDAAPRSGSIVVTCDPMCTWIATSSSDGRPPNVAKSSRAVSTATPNLLIFSPVEMCGWLLASMSGLMRTATRARQPRRAAIASMRASSPADSTLIAFSPSGTAHSSSALDFPTPVNTMSRGSNPARRATSISQIELASAALPSSRSSLTMAKVELALSA